MTGGTKAQRDGGGHSGEAEPFVERPEQEPWRLHRLLAGLHGLLGCPLLAIEAALAWFAACPRGSRRESWALATGYAFRQ